MEPGIDAVTLAAKLEQLHQERERLEASLALDADWRALVQLDARRRAGEPIAAAEAATLEAGLLGVLAGNRDFVARGKLLDDIAALTVGPNSGGGPPAGSGTAANRSFSVASRIVMLSQSGPATFRTRVRVKAASGHKGAGPVAGVDRPQADLVDALELIDGLGRPAVEVLLSHGVQRYAEIARWTSIDVATWSDRLQGLAVGPPITWIEQAAVLASGRQTVFAARARKGDFAALVDGPGPEPPVPPPAPAPAAVSGLGMRPTGQGLVRRLKQATAPDRFEAASYAAYRGSVEEASVTIIRHDGGAEAAGPRAEGQTVAQPAIPKHRFLTSLIGRR